MRKLNGFYGQFVVDPHIDFIWSVGKSTKFERHIGFGEDRLEYEVMSTLCALFPTNSENVIGYILWVFRCTK